MEMVTTIIVMRIRYLAIGSVVCILGNCVSFNLYLASNAAFSSAVRRWCFGTNTCSVMFTNSSASWNCSIRRRGARFNNTYQKARDGNDER